MKTKHIINRLRYLFYFKSRRSKFGYIGKNLKVFGKVIIHTKSKLYIGNNVRLNYGVYIQAAGGVHISDNVTISPYATILTGGYDLSGIKSLSKTIKRHLYAEVYLGEGTWIGANTTILPGVRISGKNCIIGAGSVVTNSFNENEVIIAGNPATIIKDFK